LLQGFKFTIPYRVRIVDINYGGHVANSAALNFFQDARIAYLKQLGGYSEFDIGGQCGIILTEAHVRYQAEMFHDDQLVIGARISQVGRTSFTMEYQIERDGVVTAEGQTVLVCFDYQKRRARKIDPGFEEKITAFEALK
jgi:acyl-CoA thioester hydrolase